ncbi:Phosphoglycolate phosphatase [Sterolibacterium denitrificans]|uniref:phosphoglycolate phosphatase n=1 Tax=Sterolibacterium denitrificans TaxID=157592 RepID=A0A7Z7MVW5_9PROT|nr:HAD-IA family hydrolase [Sterolibacterium denitrificans]SMB28814.1 Phosphoglycolate phosphatase [Sterolibacterium denitrificans]
MRAMVDAVLFDLDGTLADTALDLGAALNRLLIEEGRTALSAAAIRPHASNGTRGLLGLGFDITPDQEAYAGLARRFLDHYAASVCEHTVLFDGVAELLAALDERGVRWGVVTNKPQRFTLPLLDALGLTARCACIVSGDTTARPKPAPDPLLRGCQDAAARPQRSLYVGDDERDIIAGHAAGMITVIAAWGYLGEENPPENWNAAAMIETPAQVLDLLDLDERYASA